MATGRGTRRANTLARGVNAKARTAARTTSRIVRVKWLSTHSPRTTRASHASTISGRTRARSQALGTPDMITLRMLAQAGPTGEPGVHALGSRALPFWTTGGHTPWHLD